MNQSINHSINQWINQSASQSVDQSVSQSVNQSVNQSINISWYIIISTSYGYSRTFSGSMTGVWFRVLSTFLECIWIHRTMISTNSREEVKPRNGHIKLIRGWPTTQNDQWASLFELLAHFSDFFYVYIYIYYIYIYVYKSYQRINIHSS